MRKIFLLFILSVLCAGVAHASIVYTKVSGKPVNDWPGNYQEERR